MSVVRSPPAPGPGRAARPVFLLLAAILLPLAGETVRVPSAAAARDFPVLVHRPSGDGPFGVLVLLHGAGGGAPSWGMTLDLADLARRTGRVVACPSAGPFSWYVDREPDRHAATFVAIELTDWLDAHHPTRIGDRWIAGFSMGGYGALRLGLAHPDRFTACIGLAPAITVSRWESHWQLDEAMGPAGERVAYDLFRPEAIARLVAGDHPVLAITVGTEDFFFPEVTAAHRALAAAGVAHHYTTNPSAHGGLLAEALLGDLERVETSLAEAARREDHGTTPGE